MLYACVFSYFVFLSARLPVDCSSSVDPLNTFNAKENNLNGYGDFQPGTFLLLKPFLIHFIRVMKKL